MTTTAYVPVREETDTGREWFDLCALDLLPEIVRAGCVQLARKIPQWDKANPVRRIVRVEVREIAE